MSPRPQSFFDLWFLPEAEDPRHMYYLPATGVRHLPVVAHVLGAAAESLEPAWMAAAKLAYTSCLIALEPDVILLHDTSGDPRLTPNAWAACPQHPALAGPAFLLWRTDWGVRFEIPAAASEIVRKRDDWHVAAWLIERETALLRERLAQHPASTAMPEHAVAAALAVLAPVHAHLCDSTVPVAMIAPIREAGTDVAEARRLLEARDTWRAATALTHAASVAVGLLRELSRLGAFSTLDLAEIGAETVQARGARQ